ncbi:UDP-2,4-diacetamido-2,4,6-trideoxy-beta-L-altropyranose hydrolase [Pelagibacterium lentulum]|uniref:N-acetyltransferase domain-containing protein n=1 Tax=Pelagibacterium lentulum TaxID=2029865 RepID=A0A916R731_9HYPH|nr:UDP-2,4-diacetamido-2,4,6-trideoxy-beta-L-altropyranose hydrolase [Pelagibacterium lentulum]GGA40939.1 hypothetical protein GCM10011499_08140 [Pelagibacterium lentulum]
METCHKTVVFRVDASYEIGTGHVMRCLALADGLTNEGADAVFVCREHEGHLFALIEERGFRVLGLPAPRERWTRDEPAPAHAIWLGTDWRTDADETIKALDNIRPDWLVVDHYAIDARWEEQLRSISGHILAIDDLADRPHACDALVDQNLVANVRARYKDHVPDGTTLMLGPDYALLRPEYLSLREQAAPRSGPIRRVLVSFGGVDRRGLTRATVEALLAMDDHDFEVDIVLSASSPDYASMEHELAKRAGFRLHDRVPSLAPMMVAADIMIGACGTTSWERLCLGLPAIVVTVADNQNAIAEELNRQGLARWIGDANGEIGDALRAVLAEIFDAGLDPSWSRRCLEVVDGKGVQRVCAVLGAHRNMPLGIRDAHPNDEALLLEWANDPETRRNAFNPKAITPEEHHTWFQNRLGRPADCALYIAETETGVPVGQVRFERHDDQWEISYALAPIFRGRGLGRPMLVRAIAHLRRERPGVSLFGQVKPENMASRKIFEALEFAGRAAGPDRYVFERNFKE